MKKILAVFLSVITFLSAIFATGVSVLAETVEGYTVTFYEDSTKETVLYTKSKVNEGDLIYLTFDFEEEKKDILLFLGLMQKPEKK